MAWFVPVVVSRPVALPEPWIVRVCVAATVMAAPMLTVSVCADAAVGLIWNAPFTVMAPAPNV